MNKSVRHGFGLAFTPFMLLYIESWLPLLASALIAAAICGAASFMMERVDF
jgi:hypothetical protein